MRLQFLDHDSIETGGLLRMVQSPDYVLYHLRLRDQTLWFKLTGTKEEAHGHDASTGKTPSQFRSDESISRLDSCRHPSSLPENNSDQTELQGTEDRNADAQVPRDSDAAANIKQKVSTSLLNWLCDL